MVGKSFAGDAGFNLGLQRMVRILSSEKETERCHLRAS